MGAVQSLWRESPRKEYGRSSCGPISEQALHWYGRSQRTMNQRDEAYERGYLDHFCGKTFYDNPFEDGTTEARRWVDGRVQGIIDERNGVAL